MRGIAKFKLGGAEHSLPVPLEAAEAIETATDKGIMRLMREVLARDAMLKDVVTILMVAFNTSSKTREYTRTDIGDMIRQSGMFNGYLAAGKVLGALFEAPEEAKSTKGKAPAN